MTVEMPWPDGGDDVLAPVPEHDQFRDVVHRLFARHASLDDIRAATGEVEARIDIDSLWRALNQELEVGAIAVPIERGGAGYGLRELGIVLEESGAALVSAPILASSVLGVRALLLGTQGSVDDLLAGVVEGRLTATVGPLDLAGDRSQVEAPSLRATPRAGSWSVSGTIPALLQASSADLVITPALGPDGVLLVVVHLTATTVRRPRLGLDASRPRADLVLDGESAQVLVGPDRAPAGWEQLQTLAGLAVASEHAGIVGRLLDLTCDYLRQRRQFGRPVGSFQAVQHRLADLLVERERGRSAVRYAAAVFDRDPVEARLPVAVAGAVCTDAVLRAAHESVQLHGGIGFTWEHDAHLYLRRALADEGLLGGSRGYRARIADLVGLGVDRSPSARHTELNPV
jgi:alkylation response protein AidB-like acyl-CoA dehydrogenase